MEAFLALLTTAGLSVGSVAVAGPLYGASPGQSAAAAGLAARSMSPSANGTYSGQVEHGSTPGALKSPKTACSTGPPGGGARAADGRTAGSSRPGTTPIFKPSWTPSRQS